MIHELNPLYPNPHYIAKVVRILKDGGVIAYPTDTVYGLGCDLFNKKAIERIYQIKGASTKRPFSVICSEISEVARFADIPDDVFRMMKRLLPGPYTFILKASRLVPKHFITKQQTIGIRIPDAPVAIALEKALGNPIISTSANRVGEPELPNAYAIDGVFGHALDAIIDIGELTNLPSSIIDFSVSPPAIVRRGSGDLSLFE